MANYYYQFDRTSTTFSFTDTTTIPDSGYDISEFNGDSRGTPRVADWSDFSSFQLSDFNALVDAFGLTQNNALGFCSFASDLNRTSGNKYYRDLASNRAYYLTMALNSNYSGGWHATNTISTDPIKRLHVGSWQGTRRVLVYFPNYEANGGHSALIINNSISVTWNSSNSRFQSSDSSTTLSHNGTTWVINNNGTNSTASLNSSNIGSYVDPASSDIVWQNNSSVTTPSAGAQGDPHINPIFGNPYTI